MLVHTYKYMADLCTNIAFYRYTVYDRATERVDLRSWDNTQHSYSLVHIPSKKLLMYVHVCNVKDT